MSENESKFELARNLERYMAALSRLYAQKGLKQKQEIIVNSQIRIHEEWTSDSWDGGTYGHALYLVLPEAIYLRVVEQKYNLQKQIKDDINKVHDIRDEFIAEVFFEMEVLENQDWRKESGLLQSGERLVLPDTQKRIWGDEGFRVFLGHKNEVKKETAELKEHLKVFGVSGFVAHEDILPTKEWQNEIENALFSMEALVALMTEDFHESDWTDQEVGCAFGRGVPIIAVKLGRDPYGFIGKFQALSCDWDTAPTEIVKLLIAKDRMLNAYIKAVQTCVSYDQANKLSKILPSILTLSKQQASSLVSAFNENGQLRDSYGFNGTWTTIHGWGLAFHLTRLTGRTYEIGSGKIGIKE